MTQIPVRNPHTGDIDYAFEELTKSELASKISRLRENQVDWSSLEVSDRGEILTQFADGLARHKDQLAQALCVDTGRWRLSLMEVDALEAITHSRVNQAIDTLQTKRMKSESNDISHLQVFVPYPVVGVISPWNYPLILSFLDAVPALLAGCSVIIKPSEITPRFIEAVNQVLSDTVELGAVVTVVPGTASTGNNLIDLVDVINFTGSVETGRQVATRAASQLKPAFLELGGKDPAIVLESADIERAAQAILHCATVNTGQACFSIERVYVHEALASKFIHLISSLAEEISLNTEDPAKGVIGPIISAKQIQVIDLHLNDAREKKASFLTGGVIEQHGGSWLRPTVVTDVDHSMLLMQKETFAPIIPIMTFKETSEAVYLANDSEYGLSAAVFGDLDKSEAVALNLDAG
ncbi:MAG: aldehyde dehydrogenase family protein, partial [Gammaproteobacteria bacterium]|nr:aldehyde dehydrogenase family protein [Gammaproteobacteria bacterium]